MQNLLHLTYLWKTLVYVIIMILVIYHVRLHKKKLYLYHLYICELIHSTNLHQISAAWRLPSAGPCLRICRRRLPTSLKRSRDSVGNSNSLTYLRSITILRFSAKLYLHKCTKENVDMKIDKKNMLFRVCCWNIKIGLSNWQESLWSKVDQSMNNSVNPSVEQSIQDGNISTFVVKHGKTYINKGMINQLLIWLFAVQDHNVQITQ